ncbi:adenylate isopentenyltransferase 3, chloroplastic-like [Prosopis cineraria]|uniref:adenylate isopentenyltransferase 3, chloroplastic-like n=1 Tax=Prosopis cineraria TaxID=364024 RepID=UPI00240EE9FC|nr:adenylate isopentenyltransferase 3, chloroplastic-like [Prosopis cineraria]
MNIPRVMSRNVTQPQINSPSSGRKLNPIKLPRQKEKVVVVMGATGTGKSRLSIDLATVFHAQIINSDKMQVYEGLDIVTNKITKEDRRGVPHHLLGTESPYSEFTASHFRDAALLAIESITSCGQLPIIVGGSNSYIEALIDDYDYKFRSRYDFCCLSVDVSMPVLDQYVAKRVDQMLENGMVDELRPLFNPKGDYSRGIRKAIGVPEFDQYFRKESFIMDEGIKQRLVEEAVNEMKKNTYKLARKQLGKIHRLHNVKRWKIQRLNATTVFCKHGEEAEEAWKKKVAEPSARMVARFLFDFPSANVGAGLRLCSPSALRSAMATATCDGYVLTAGYPRLSIF